MKKIFKITLFAAFLLSIAVSANLHAAAATPNESAVCSLKLPKFIVEFLTPTEAALVWGVIPGTGLYRVGVYDLTTNERVTTFTTDDQKALVSGLPAGHVFRFTVSRGLTTLTVVAPE